MTYALISLTVLVYIIQIVPNSPVQQALLYYGPYTFSEPWRMLTALFLHGSILHILLNMLSLFLFGRELEGMLGRLRFVALYLISGFGGSVAVLLLAPFTPVVGASGAIFGLLGAYFVIQRKLGGNNVQLVVLIGLNILIGFLPNTNIAWQAHLGGLAVGAAVAFVYMKTRSLEQRATQIALIAAIVGVLIVVVVLAGVVL
ncbi:MAG: rhomboid family intramembrane serine protease [Rhodoglobus sp.]